MVLPWLIIRLSVCLVAVLSLEITAFLAQLIGLCVSCVDCRIGSTADYHNPWRDVWPVDAVALHLKYCYVPGQF